MKRALVAVGVDKTSSADFRPLNAAASGAKDFAAWAKVQEFDVALLTDQSDPVTVGGVFEAVRNFVDKRVYSQLVLYFSGHGILLSPDAEVWLLSGALSNPNEAVNVSASISAARTCGIPHVVFISDACRSLPTNFRMGSLRPGAVFPTEQPRSPGPEVDVFYATLPGDPALELPPDEAQKQYRGLLTACLLKALAGDPASLIQEVEEGATKKYVVASRKVKKYLFEAVPLAAAAVSIRLNQEPDVRVESDLPKYLAQLDIQSGPAKAPSPPEPASPLPEIIIDTSRPVTQRVHQLSQSWSKWARQQLLDVPDYRDTRESIQEIIESVGRRSFETMTGFTFFGLEAVSVKVTDALAPTELFVEHNAVQARVHVREPLYYSGLKRAALVRFSNNTGLLLSVLPGHIGTVVAKDGRVLTVNYTPSKNNTEAYMLYEGQASEIEKSRALMATLARHGSLRLDPDKAGETADFLRRYKRLDPTLGLFAAYAYAQAGNSKEVLSVYRYMVQDGLPVFFDVALLAAQVPYVGPEDYVFPWPPPKKLDFAPWMPLLTQGWLLVGEFEKSMPHAVLEAKKYLVPGLWTTFTREGLDILDAALFAKETT